jgi:hypothetical protein
VKAMMIISQHLCFQHILPYIGEGDDDHFSAFVFSTHFTYACTLAAQPYVVEAMAGATCCSCYCRSEPDFL